MSDPKTGPGTTSDPNQANLTGNPGRKAKPVPPRSDGPPQRNDDPLSGPGTTSDPNQANRT